MRGTGNEELPKPWLKRKPVVLGGPTSLATLSASSASLLLNPSRPQLSLHPKHTRTCTRPYLCLA